MDNEESEKMIMNDNNSIGIPLIIEGKAEKKIYKIVNIFLLLFAILIFSLSFYIRLFPDDKYTSRYHSLKRMKKYIRKCFDGELLNNNTQNYSENEKPIISSVIPVYNSQKTIKAAVRSIQNQDMKNMEIILVNDNSKDNSSKILAELMKEDKRIKVINNTKNMGALYSRCIGILHSKGDYIMNLDNDDLFIDTDIYDVVYNIIKREQFDIIGFAAVEAYEYNPLISSLKENYFHNHKENLTIFQPNLTFFPYTKAKSNGELYFSANDYHVWGRLVVTDLYKKAINNLGRTALGEERMTRFLAWGEDTLMSIVLFYFAKSYKFVRKYGIFHWLSSTTASNTRPDEENLFGEYCVLDAMFDFTENKNNSKRFIVDKSHEITVLGDFYIPGKSEFNNFFLNEILKKVMKSPYVDKKHKKKITEYFKDSIRIDL